MSLLGSLGGTSIVGSLLTGSSPSVGGIAGGIADSVGGGSKSSSSGGLFGSFKDAARNAISGNYNETSDNLTRELGAAIENKKDLNSSFQNGSGGYTGSTFSTGSDAINSSFQNSELMDSTTYSPGNSYSRTRGLGLSNPEYISYTDNMLK